MAVEKDLKTKKRNNFYYEVEEPNPSPEENERENFTEKPEHLDE